MLRGSIPSKTLVAMQRADGSLDSEVHCEGHIIKPDPKGVVLVPSQFVLSLMMAGYMHVPPEDQN
jgi:hypothetical protein